MNVWAGIINIKVLGPFVFEETSTGPRNLEFLQHFLIHELNRLFSKSNDLWLHQDGAPSHDAGLLRNYLDNVFPNL